MQLASTLEKACEEGNQTDFFRHRTEREEINQEREHSGEQGQGMEDPDIQGMNMWECEEHVFPVSVEGRLTVHTSGFPPALSTPVQMPSQTSPRTYDIRDRSKLRQPDGYGKDGPHLNMPLVECSGDGVKYQPL